MNEINKNEAAQTTQAKVSEQKASVSTLAPLADIYETKQGATLYVDLPGVSKESLDIDIDQHVLTIKGAINLDMPEKLEPTYMEVRSQQFERRFTLGEELDSSRIEANLNQGELKLFIPRSEKHKPRKIEVKSA